MKEDHIQTELKLTPDQASASNAQFTPPDKGPPPKGPNPKGFNRPFDPSTEVKIELIKALTSQQRHACADLASVPHADGVQRAGGTRAAELVPAAAHDQGDPARRAVGPGRRGRAQRAPAATRTRRPVRWNAFWNCSRPNSATRGPSLSASRTTRPRANRLRWRRAERNLFTFLEKTQTRLPSTLLASARAGLLVPLRPSSAHRTPSEEQKVPRAQFTIPLAASVSPPVSPKASEAWPNAQTYRL